MSLEYRQQVGMEKSAQNSQEHGVGKKTAKKWKKGIDNNRPYVIITKLTSKKGKQNRYRISVFVIENQH